ncbi:CoF synthetase [uncultured Aquimarina sp.]|uniref:CoF synthetase n=1 Tax=uncultured Aquimarina sp. TaxID=575652 RepID=UPI002607DB71|nr:CoF synthetase [uncultured Aquimarina sp.]
MKVFEKLRNILFWSIDFAKGGKVLSHFKDIKYIAEHPNDDLTLKKTHQYLNSILTHAIENTEFYKNIRITKLKNFPVITKETIRNSYSDFESYTFKNKKRVKVTTSGSTGASFSVYQDLNKKARNIADIIYYSEISGFHVGYKLYYLRFWDMFKKKSKILSFLQNIVPINVFDLSPESIQNLVNTLKNDRSSKGMIGYASSFNKICNYLETVHSEPIKCNLKSVIGISERLDGVTKMGMKKYFGVDMVSRYSNSENGMIAQQPIGEEYFDINWGSYYVEILEISSNEPVTPGTLGRIVVTDLFNYLTPIIRYDTGDLGCIDYISQNNISRLVLTKIEGRKMDMIRNTEGDILSTSILLLINKYDEIVQRQIVQKTKNEYLFRLKTKNNIFDQEDVFKKEFKEYLGQDAIISIDLVTDIALLPSGKERAIINEVI